MAFHALTITITYECSRLLRCVFCLRKFSFLILVSTRVGGQQFCDSVLSIWVIYSLSILWNTAIRYAFHYLVRKHTFMEPKFDIFHLGSEIRLNIRQHLKDSFHKLINYSEISWDHAMGLHSNYFVPLHYSYFSLTMPEVIAQWATHRVSSSWRSHFSSFQGYWMLVASTNNKGSTSVAVARYIYPVWIVGKTYPLYRLVGE